MNEVNTLKGLRIIARSEIRKVHRDEKVMQKITVKTRKKREILDITDTVEALLHKNRSQAAASSRKLP